MKFLKNFLSVILSIFIIIVVFALTYVIGVNHTIGKKEVVTNIIIDAGFSKDIKEVVDNDIKKYNAILEKEVKNHLKENGVNLNNSEVDKIINTVKKEIPTLLNEVSKKENIDSLFSSIIEKLYESEEVSVSDVLKEEVDKVIKENNINVTDDTKKEIDAFLDDLATTINEEIDNSFEGSFGLNESKDAIKNPIPEYLRTLRTIEYSLIGGLIILIVLVILLNLKKVTGIVEICTSFILAGLSVKIFNSLLINPELIKLGKDEVSLLIDNIRESIVNLTTKIANGYIITVVIILIAVICYKVIAKYKRNKGE